MFSTKSLKEDYAVEEEYPGNNWSSYRLSRANMESIRYHSTQWRATCEFPTIGIDFKDYFCASLSSFDPLHPSTNSHLTCKLYEFINIRGNQCIKCTAATVERCVRVARGVAEINSSFLSFITFSTRWKFFFFSTDLFADVMSGHNRNMKHAHAIEFDYTNLLAML